MIHIGSFGCKPHCLRSQDVADNHRDHWQPWHRWRMETAKSPIISLNSSLGISFVLNVGGRPSLRSASNIPDRHTPSCIYFVPSLCNGLPLCTDLSKTVITYEKRTVNYLRMSLLVAFTNFTVTAAAWGFFFLVSLRGPAPPNRSEDGFYCLRLRGIVTFFEVSLRLRTRKVSVKGCELSALLKYGDYMWVKGGLFWTGSELNLCIFFYFQTNRSLLSKITLRRTS